MSDTPVPDSVDSWCWWRTLFANEIIVWIDC